MTSAVPEPLDDLWSDRRWRLNNLYHIVNEDGKKVPFRLNWAQEKLLNELHYLNVILKARQLGFCLSPSCRVLTADLRWRALRYLRPGDELVAVDEDNPGGRGCARKMRTAIVQGVMEVRREAYRITFDDGRRVVCTGQHPWLSKKVGSTCKWRTIEANTKKKLLVGSYVRWITEPWPRSAEYFEEWSGFEDGWFGGLIDGEGCLRRKNNAGTELSVSQVSGAVLDRARAYLVERGYTFREEIDNRKSGDSSKFGNKPVHKLVLGRSNELFRLIGQTCPMRFINQRWWEGKELPGKKTSIGWAEIVKIEKLGEQNMVDLQTSTGTYIAEGFVSHNTTVIDLYMLDECVFNSNVRAGVIAHTREDAENFFRDKVKFPYDNLDEAIKAANPATQDSARHLSFRNNSSIRVGTSMRSGTLQILHVSEYGKICAKFPEKATEIKTGAFNTVHAGQMISVESTAEGQDGDFYDMIQTAMELKRRDAQLTELDFKFHFFPWFQHPGYRLPHGQVTIPAKMGGYFEKLRTNHGIQLTADQQAWYVAKARQQGTLMKREFPSTPEEAFEAAIEGAYYANEMAQIDLDKRVRAIPLEKGLAVHTWWDLGQNDLMSIGFVQLVNGWFHVVDYYENSGYGLAHYAEMLQTKQRKRGFVYGEHVWPHDGNVRILDEKGRKRTEVMRGLGYEPRVVPRTSDVNDGIELVRNMLAKCVFDQERCEPLVKALKSYRREWDEKTATWRDKPLHNWACHPADMMRCGAEHQPTSGDFDRKIDYGDGSEYV